MKSGLTFNHAGLTSYYTGALKARISGHVTREVKPPGFNPRLRGCKYWQKITCKQRLPFKALVMSEHLRTATGNVHSMRRQGGESLAFVPAVCGNSSSKRLMSYSKIASPIPRAFIFGNLLESYACRVSPQLLLRYQQRIGEYFLFYWDYMYQS